MAQTRRNTKPRKCDKNHLSCLLYLKMKTVTFKKISREIAVGNCLRLSCSYISCCWTCHGQTRPPMLTSLSVVHPQFADRSSSPPPSLCTFKPRRAAALSFLRRILKQGDIISRIARIPPSPSLQEPFGARKEEEEEEEEEQFLSHLASPQLFPPLPPPTAPSM